MNGIKGRFGSHVALFLEKRYLDRTQWEEGMRMLGRDANWDRMPDRVLIYASQGRLPDAFLALASAKEERNGAEDGGRHKRVVEEKTWRISHCSIPDVTGSTWEC